MSRWFAQVTVAVAGILRGNQSVRRSRRGSLSTLCLEPRVFLSAKLPTTPVIDISVANRREDGFEDNDLMSTATDRGTLTTVSDVSGGLFDDDWFQFTTTLPGQAGDFVRTTFTHSRGDLDMQLYNSVGGLLGESTGTTNTEEISLSGRGAGTYFVRLFGYSGATNRSYTLRIDPPSPPVDDAYEENDSLGTASNLGTLTTPQNIPNLTLLDYDYFRFTTTTLGTSASFVGVDFNNDLGDVDLYLYDSSQAQIRTSASSSNNYERISLDGLAAGEYTIWVHPFEGSNPSYDLSIAPPNAKDGEHTLYLNFDGYNISRSELVAWNNGEWLEGSDDFLDPGLDGITVLPFLASRAEREQVITQMLSMLTIDLAPFGIQPVRHFGAAVEGQEATTIFLGPSSHGLHVACDIDYGNVDQTDIAFVGDEWWGSASSTAIAMADVALHEAGHTFGLYHVNSGRAVETMGLRYNNPQSRWVKNTAFLDKTYRVLAGHGPDMLQNSYQYMLATFVSITPSPQPGLFTLNQSAVTTTVGSSLLSTQNRRSLGIV